MKIKWRGGKIKFIKLAPPPSKIRNDVPGWNVMMNCRKQFKCFAVCLIVMINCRKNCYCWIVYVKLSKKKWLSNSFEVLFWLIVESFCSIVEKSTLCRKQLHIVHKQSGKGVLCWLLVQLFIESMGATHTPHRPTISLSRKKSTRRRQGA